MATILNADNGVVSGISGLTTSADNSGVLQFQTSGTATLEISTAGNINIPGTGKRITGDFSNATIANRVAFQTSTANGATSIYILPNGTSPTSQFVAVNNSDPTNASVLQLQVNATDYQIRGGITGTGTYLPLTMYTGGSERLRIDTSGNVGIGTTSPNARLTSGDGSITYKNSSASTSTVRELFNYVNTTVSSATANGLSVGFRTSDSFPNRGASVRMLQTGNSDSGGDASSIVSFWTYANGSDNGSERMRIDSSGNVGIGTTPGYKLDVSGNNGIRVTNTGTISIGTQSSYAAGFGNGNADLTLGTDGSYAYIQSWASKPLVLNNAGNGIRANGDYFYVDKGVQFPATQYASSNANTLDDYEEGTFTPTITFGGSSTGITYSFQTGRYTKIGNMVSVYASAGLTNKGSSTGNLAMSGFPFTCANTGNPVSAIYGYLTGISSQLIPYISGTTVTVEQINSGSQSAVTSSQVTNTSTFYFSMTYQVS